MATRLTPDQLRTTHPEAHEAQVNWAKANGLNPDDVSASYPIVVIDGIIHYREHVRSETGHKLLDMTTETEMATNYRRVPLVEPMPEEWPTCPTCHR